jgi:DNA-binding transcriptional LysR family regulator
MLQYGLKGHHRMPIDLLQLRTFVAVAEEQQLTRAAERLHISLSAASAQIRAVEDMLQVELFTRTNRSLELTAAGQILLRRAKALLNDAETFTSFARGLSGKACGRLAIGTSSDPNMSRIGRIIATLGSTHPLINVEVFARHSSATHDGMKAGELDVGVFLGQPADTAFDYLVLSAIRYRVAGPAAWKDRIAKADWAELAALPWIAYTDRTMAYAQMLHGMFAPRGLANNVVVRTDNDALVRSMMLAGVGLSLVREESALEYEATGAFVVSPIGCAEFHLLAASMASRRADPLIDAFLGAVKTAWPDARSVTSTGAGATEGDGQA